MEDVYLKKLAKSATIVATNGCFDIIHAGHIKFLQAAKLKGDILVVGINSDRSIRKLKGSNRPINNQQDRFCVLSSLRMVDYVLVFDDTNCVEFLEKVRPHIYVKASDYNLNNLNPLEKEILDKYHIDIQFVPYYEGLSTSNILKKI